MMNFLVRMMLSALLLMIALLSMWSRNILNFFNQRRTIFLRRKSVPIEAYETLANLVASLVKSVEQSLQDERESRSRHEERILAMLQANLMAPAQASSGPVGPTMEQE